MNTKVSVPPLAKVQVDSEPAQIQYELGDVMVDLETLGRRAGCIVLSIGAVGFSERGLSSEFYTVVSMKDQVQLGLHQDPQTRTWWDSQSEEARAVLYEAEVSRITLKRALMMFNRYLTPFTFSRVCLWGNGADFDLAILINLYAHVGLEPPWKFWNHRCFRTLKNLHPHVKMARRTGTYHNALDDAKTQALHAIQILRHAP